MKRGEWAGRAGLEAWMGLPVAERTGSVLVECAGLAARIRSEDEDEAETWAVLSAYREGLLIDVD